MFVCSGCSAVGGWANSVGLGHTTRVLGYHAVVIKRTYEDLESTDLRQDENLIPQQVSATVSYVIAPGITGHMGATGHVRGPIC